MIQRQARRRAATLRVAKLRAELDAAAHEVIAAEHAIQADLAAGKEAEEAEEKGDQEEEEEETPVDEEVRFYLLENMVASASQLMLIVFNSFTLSSCFCKSMISQSRVSDRQ